MLASVADSKATFDEHKVSVLCVLGWSLSMLSGSQALVAHKL